MPPRVSVITPTYNHEGFIGQCIESVQGQSFRDWEMIIVDDGSTDRTAEIAERYAAKDDRVVVISRENVGIFRLAETYNAGLERSSGSLVAILEGDDVWLPRKLELQVAAFDANPEAVLSWGDVAIASTELVQIGTSRSSLSSSDRRYYENRPVGAILNELYIENIVSATTVVVRREQLEEIGGFQHRDGLPLIDFPTILAFTTLGPFAYVGETLARWRWHPGQVTKSYYAQIIRGVRDMALDHFDALPASIRDTLNVSRNDITGRYRRVVHDSYIQSGRYKLLQRRFGEARSDYRRALFYPRLVSLKNRMIALVGIGSSLVGADVEWLARMTGKKPIT